ARTMAKRCAIPAAGAVAPLAAALAVGIAGYPGRWTPDTAEQYREIRSGRYIDWFGPVFNALLHSVRLFDRHLGLLLPLQLSLLAISVYVVLCLILRPSIASAVSTGIVLSPPVLSWGIVLSRDVWYGAAYAAMGALTAAALWSAARWWARVTSLVGATCFAFLAVGIRQNGVFAVLPVVAFTIWILCGRAI